MRRLASRRTATSSIEWLRLGLLRDHDVVRWAPLASRRRSHQADARNAGLPRTREATGQSVEAALPRVGPGSQEWGLLPVSKNPWAGQLIVMPLGSILQA